MIAKYDNKFVFNKLYDNKVKIWIGQGHRNNNKNIAHWHKGIEIIYVRKGFINVSVNMDRFNCDEGDVVFCSSGDIHYLHTTEDSMINVLIFDPSLINASFREFRFNYISSELLQQKNINISQLFLDLKQELNNKSEYYEYSIQSKLTLCFVNLFRSFNNDIYSKKEKSKSKIILLSYQKLIDYIDVNYSTVTFEQASKFMNYSIPHFSKVFKKISGMNFSEYINLIRIEKSIELIKENQHSITFISDQCGFCNIRNFNRVFKKYTGLTPKEITSDFVFEVNPTKVSSKSNDPNLNYKN